MVGTEKMCTVQMDEMCVGGSERNRHRSKKLRLGRGPVGTFATLETELIDRQPRRRFRTRAEANREVFSYLEGFYNLRRIYSALNYRSPVAYERRYAQEHGSTANPKMNCPSN
ncbi:MAG: IS3 family transposase [Gammaproteobacteria bacterium]|nr:IS3 family transposase [Gammaproteobacteria bacterium]